jgi:uncharacterized protein (TIGR03663 family)
MERRDGADDPARDSPSDPADREPATDPAAGADGSAHASNPRQAVLDRLRAVPLWGVLAAVVVLALLARVVLLGARSAHWDEARVAHWIVHYQDFGAFAYRHIIHGPLIQHVNQVGFSVLGRTDFAMRLPVALVGGLLPATAYLFREHLDRDELVVMALFLAGNSVLLYYSRFMRSDVLVAAFMFAGLGMLVRYSDTRRARYLYAFGALAALGIASKENAVVYVLTWLGAAALLLDTGLYRPREDRTGWDRIERSRVGSLGRALFGLALVPLDGWAALRSRTGDPRRTARRWLRLSGQAALAVAVFLAVVVFLFAPRGQGLSGIYLNGLPPGQDTVALGLWEAVGRPAAFPGFVADTLTYTWGELTNWFGAASQPGCGKDTVIGGYVCFLGRFAEVLLTNAAVLGIAALFGFLYERYAAAGSRNLVMFAGYTGAVSVVGYPLGTDIFGAWLVVHALVPLSIPAAVGVARVYRWGREAALSGDDAAAAAVGLLLLVAAVGVAGPTVTDAYADHSGPTNNLVQYAQPTDDLDPVADRLAAVTADHEGGPDLLLYSPTDGDSSLVRNVSADRFPKIFRPVCSNWPETLPLNWYLVRENASVACETGAGTTASPEETAARLVAGDPPPLILTRADALPPDADALAAYEHATYRIRKTDTDVSVFVHEDWAG